jgi:hypothetical protein
MWLIIVLSPIGVVLVVSTIWRVVMGRWLRFDYILFGKILLFTLPAFCVGMLIPAYSSYLTIFNLGVVAVIVYQAKPWVRG